MTFIQAKSYTPVVGRQRKVRVIVLHSAESPEKPGKALSVAKWFARDDAPKASAHFVVDATDVVQCVREEDVAWAAPGANSDGIHIELTGYARQTPEDWFDTYSASMLDLASRLVADLCVRFGVPPRALVAADLLAGASGITRHMDVTEAYKRSTHVDPGVGFPMARFVQHVAELVDAHG